MTDFDKLVDLASERLGGRAIEANDEFFGGRSNLLRPAKPAFIDGKFTARGKWMDGWETRRRRTPGHDWCIVRLGLPGIVRGILVDTSYFKGNFPARFSLDALDLGGHPPYSSERARLKATDGSWVELLPETPLAGDSQNEFTIPDQHRRFTHVRLKIYPDGGVARLRVYGEVDPERTRALPAEVDLANIRNGGRVLRCSDEFFGVPLNMLLPGPGKNMGDGWETRRRRDQGHDWAIVKLGLPGTIRRVEVDTAHFKGNFPESCSLEGCYAKTPDWSETPRNWRELLPRTQLRAHSRHTFREQLVDVGAVTHVRFNIYPDGGVSRLRLFGEPQARSPSAAIHALNNLSEKQAHKALLDCCGSAKWVLELLKLRPFLSVHQLLEAADQVWSGLDEKDWLEAFAHHPPVGAKKATARGGGTASRWSAGEQSRARLGSQEIRAQLAVANRAYYAKFGTVFLICATGKTAEEILEGLRARLSNEWGTEVKIAAEEQRKITRLRLEKLLSL